jgi:hypothetical protein
VHAAVNARAHPFIKYPPNNTHVDTPQALLKLTGYTAPLLEGKLLSDIMRESDSHLAEAVLQKCLKGMCELLRLFSAGPCVLHCIVTLTLSCKLI